VQRVEQSSRRHYERAMRQLEVGIGLLSVVLLALAARALLDGPTTVVTTAAVPTALLLAAAVGLWRQGRGLDPDRGSAWIGGTHGCR
jgi:hypothetical protein